MILNATMLMILMIYLIYDYYHNSQSYGMQKMIQDAVSSFFGNLTASMNIQINIDVKPEQKFKVVKTGKHESQSIPVFTRGDDLSGTIELELAEKAKCEHAGLKCYLIGYLGRVLLMQRFMMKRIFLRNLCLCRRNCSQLGF